MKKFITLLFCSALFSSAFAQSNNHRNDWKYDNNRDNNNYDNRRDEWNNHHNNTAYHNNRYSTEQRDQLIQRVSREYDYRIQQISYDRYLNRREKRHAIKSLQAQKAEQINRIYTEYNNRYAYSDNRNPGDKYDEHNGNGHYSR